MPSDAAARPLVHIYSDGACSPNPGVGGWAAVLLAPEYGDYRSEISGAEAATTNNRMELTGALMGLKALKRPSRVLLHTDSTYVRNAFEKGWLKNWQRNGWLTRERKAVLNEDLWRELLVVTQLHEVSWIWVPGHADVIENNRCDALAVAARIALSAKLAAT